MAKLPIEDSDVDDIDDEASTLALGLETPLGALRGAPWALGFAESELGEILSF